VSAETTVLVTGGAGFVGSAVCRALLGAGARVVVYDDLSFGRRALVAPGCAFVQGDVRNASALAEVLAAHRPRIVCHLAALHFIPYCNAHPVEAMDVNVNGTRALLEACRTRRPERILFASTGAVYPLDGGPFTEEHATAPTDVYGYTKQMGEDLVRLFTRETGVASVTARFFNAFGPNETNPHLVPDLLAQVTAGDTVRLGNLEPVRDYVHTDDLAAAVVALARGDTTAYDVFNVGSGEGRSVRDVVSTFEEALGRRLTIVQDPARVRAVERHALVADVSKLRGIGWQPRVGFDEGIRRLTEGLSARG
jgi:UDP-glucose 4-epimerase